MENVQGFFDLCIQEHAVAGNYAETITTLYKHGYRTIAINYQINEADAKENTEKTGGKKKRKGDNKSGESNNSLLPSILKLGPVKGCESMKILARLTIQLMTKEFYIKISKLPEFKNFHIIAILPCNNVILNIVCNEIDADILAIKCTERNDVLILRKHYSQLLANGYHFELLYAPGIGSESSRRFTISSAHGLHTVGKSRNVIVSSGITSAKQVRSPYDIINLGLLYGLNHAQSKMAVMQNCRNVYYHAVSRRYGKVAMLGTTVASGVESAAMDVSVIELDDDDDDVADVGHQLKKIKT